MRILVLFVCGLLAAAQQAERAGHALPDASNGSLPRLPNGRLQQDEMLKADHAQNIKDIAQLIKLGEEVQDDLLKQDRHVLSLGNLKKLDEIEKLSKRLRTRMKR